MDIIITHVYDKCRFGYYMKAKFQMYKPAAITMANDINNGYFVKLCDLPECDVLYLQRPNIRLGRYFAENDHKICNLKIINNMTVERKPTIPPYCDNKKESFNKIMKDSYKKITEIDISPQPGDELKQEPLTLFHVTFTKVIHYDEMLNERQIQALLKDNHVKSINIEK